MWNRCELHMVMSPRARKYIDRCYTDKLSAIALLTAWNLREQVRNVEAQNSYTIIAIPKTQRTQRYPHNGNMNQVRVD